MELMFILGILIFLGVVIILFFVGRLFINQVGREDEKNRKLIMGVVESQEHAVIRRAELRVQIRQPGRISDSSIYGDLIFIAGSLILIPYWGRFRVPLIQLLDRDQEGNALPGITSFHKGVTIYQDQVGGFKFEIAHQSKKMKFSILTSKAAESLTGLFERFGIETEAGD